MNTLSHNGSTVVPTYRRHAWLAAALLAVAGFATNQPAAALTIQFDTASLAGTDARFEFSLFDGDLTENNSVTISNIATDGSLLSTDCTVSCTGAYAVSDTGGFGQFLQDLTLGTRFSFELGFSQNFAAGLDAVSDRLSISLLDPSTDFNLLTTNLSPSGALPVNDALLRRPARFWKPSRSPSRSLEP